MNRFRVLVDMFNGIIQEFMMMSFILREPVSSLSVSLYFRYGTYSMNVMLVWYFLVSCVCHDVMVCKEERTPLYEYIYRSLKVSQRWK
jgi:hypothetical protein